MTRFSLYRRMREQGTLTEKASDVPDALFALPSTVNWMRSLAILVKEQSLDFGSACSFYQTTQRRAFSDEAINTICEQLLFALHQLASLGAMTFATNCADVARTGIMAWYYGVYGSASAMIAAADGSFTETHAATANQWDRQLVVPGLVMPPFADRISSLIASTSEAELLPIRQRGQHPLSKKPTNSTEAMGCCAEYLSGTVKWERWNVEERVRESRDFKALGVADFRTKVAKGLRDAGYARRSVSFLHQASRYRGKANYRDAIYLAYGTSVASQLDGYSNDLHDVLWAFACMAGAYARARLGRELWEEFVSDLDAKRAISLSPRSVWP